MQPLSGCETRQLGYLHVIIPCAVLILLVRTRKNTHTKWKTITMVVGMYSSELLPSINGTRGWGQYIEVDSQSYFYRYSLGDCLVLAIREWHMTCLGECVVYTALASPTLAYLGSYQSLLLSWDTQHWPDTQTGLRWFITAFVTSLSSQTVINPSLNTCEK